MIRGWHQRRGRTGNAEVGGDGVELFDLFKGERPGSGDRFGVLLAGATAPFQERGLACTVLLEVGGQAALGFLDVGPGLVEGERQPVHFARDGFGGGAVGGAGLLERIAGWQHSGAAQEEQHGLVHVHLLDGQAVGERAGSVRAGGEQDMPFASWW